MKEILNNIANRFVGTGISKYIPYSQEAYALLHKAFNKHELKQVQIPNGCTLSVWQDDTGVGLYLLSKGEYEPFVTDLLMSKVSDQMTVLDVGANIGYYTTQFGKRANRVFAFEPEREVATLLQHNVNANQLENVAVINAAVGSENGTIGFKSDPNNRANSEIDNENPDYTVPIWSVDVYCEQNNITPDLIKVDVEGFEIEFLKGAMQTLQQQRPILMMEYNPDALRHQGQEPEVMISMLLEMGYKLEIVSEQQMQVIPYSVESLNMVIEKEFYTNILASK